MHVIYYIYIIHKICKVLILCFHRFISERAMCMVAHEISIIIITYYYTEELTSATYYGTSASA